MDDVPADVGPTMVVSVVCALALSLPKASYEISCRPAEGASQHRFNP